jgi:hypothetical protein
VHFGEQTTDEMAFTFLQIALPSQDDIPEFRRETLLSRLEMMIDSGDDFSALPARQAQMLKMGITMFDKNKNGKLEPEEKEALMQFIRTQIK